MKPLRKSACRRGASILFVFATILGSTGAQGHTELLFGISIAPSQNATQPGKPVWSVGTPVFVIVKMTNNSSGTLHLSLSNPGFDYRMTVLDNATGAASFGDRAIPQDETGIAEWASGREIYLGNPQTTRKLPRHNRGQLSL